MFNYRYLLMYSNFQMMVYYYVSTGLLNVKIILHTSQHVSNHLTLNFHFLIENYIKQYILDIGSLVYVTYTHYVPLIIVCALTFILLALFVYKNFIYRHLFFTIVQIHLELSRDFVYNQISRNDEFIRIFNVS